MTKITLEEVQEEFARSAMAESVRVPIETWVAYLNMAQFALTHGYEPAETPSCQDDDPEAG